MLIELRLSAHNLLTIFKVIVAVNICLLAGSFIFNTASTHLPSYLFIFLRETDLATENVFAAWYSSMLLLLSAVMSFNCFLMDAQIFQKRENQILNYGWLIYTFVFALLSFDELGSVHEYIGDFIAFEKAGELVMGTKDSGWILFYVVVAFVSLFMFVFSVIRLKKARWALPLMVAGLLLYLSNPFQEFMEIESMRAAASDETWKRPVHFLLLEEGTELFGSLFFLIAISLYGFYTSREVNTKDVADDLVFRKQISKSVFMRLIYCFLLSMALCLLLINIWFGDVIGDLQNGVPKNWITACTAFMVSMYCFIIFNKEKTKRSYLLFSAFSMCLSIYYGSNRFAYNFDSDYSWGRLVLRSALCVFALVAYLKLNRHLETRFAKPGLMVSFVILATGIFAKRPYSSEITFIGLCCLILFLLADRLQLQFFNKKLPV